MIAGLIAAGLTGLGVLILLMGTRGRRMDLNPVCRRCRFDLQGLNSPVVCPECGAALAGRRAVRLGNRRRSRGVIVLGVLVVLGGLGLGGVLGWGAAASFNWNTVKPGWWLTRELRSGDSGVMDAAAVELLARAQAKKLASGDWKRAIERGLVVQGDAAGPWSASLGNLLDLARTEERLSEEQVLQYARQGSLLLMEVRPKVAIDAPLPTRLTFRSPRLGASDALKVRAQLVESKFAGHTETFAPNAGALFTINPQGSSSISGAKPVPELEPGVHEVRERWRFILQEGYRSDAPALATWEQEFVGSFEAMPAGSPGVVLLEDESLAQAIRDKFKLRAQVTVGGTNSVDGQLDMMGPPIALAFDMYWRAQDGAGGWREAHIMSFSCQPGQNMGYAFSANVPEEFTSGTVDVILRTNPAVAESTIDLVEIWKGEILIPEVQVKVNRP